jgi:hypothetical protein
LFSWLNLNSMVETTPDNQKAGCMSIRRAAVICKKVCKRGGD